MLSEGTPLSLAGFRLPPRLAAWIAVCLRYTSTQVLVQLLSLGSGILLVRCLDKSQYALFTVFGLVQGTMNVLADNGISMALTSEGGRVFHDRKAFGRLINSALPIRRVMGLAALAIMAPIGALLLHRAGSPLPVTVALLALLGVTFHFNLLNGVLNVVPRLLGQVGRIQQLDLLAAAARLALIALAAWLLVINAIWAAAIAAATVAWQWWTLRRWVAADLPLDEPASPAERAAILTVVRRVTPNTLFFCVQGQLTYWLVGFFASSDQLAEVGALGRLAIIFSVVGSLLTTVIAPAFARCQEPRRLLRVYLSVVGLFTACCTLGFLLCALFPTQLLWVLGKNYAHLQNELLLMVGSMLLGAITATMFTLNSARAWVDVAWVEIPLRIALQIALLFAFDITTVRGVLWFGLLSNLSPLVVNVVLAYRGFRSIHRTDA